MKLLNYWVNAKIMMSILSWAQSVCNFIVWDDNKEVHTQNIIKLNLIIKTIELKNYMCLKLPLLS